MIARRLAVAAALALSAAPAAAQFNYVVTSPAGASQTVDPFPGFDTWYRDDVRPGATAGITTTYARSGNGSMLLTNSGSSAKANVAHYFNPAAYPLTALGLFEGFGYDYYRASSSTAAVHLAPAMRLLVDADGDLSTTNDRGSLIYEPVYNGVSSAAVDQWTTVNVGGSTNLWWFQTGVGAETVYNRTLSDYQYGYTPTMGFAQLSFTSLVYGLNFGTGSGWAGDFAGAVDNVNMALGLTSFGPAPTITVEWNFEAPVTATPEPATIALVAGGLIAVAGVARRRRTA